MSIHNLPTELVRMIAETFNVDERYQLAGIIRTNRRYNGITAPYLWTTDSILRAFSYAARKDKVDCFLKAVKENAFRQNGLGGKPPPGTLLTCCEHGSINVAKMIVLFWPQILSEDIDGLGQRPLTKAAGAGHVQMVEWLVTYPSVRPDELDRDGKTPLIWACHNGHVDIVNKLLRLPNVDINRRSWNRRTPLAAAVESSQVEVMRIIISDTRFDITTVWQNLLDECVVGNKMEPLLLLLSYHEVEPYVRDFWGYDALVSALFYERVDMVKAFNEYTTIDINTMIVGSYNARFVDPIIWRVLQFYEPRFARMFKLLFDFPNLDVNIRRMTDHITTALVFAVSRNQNSEARMLIKHRCDLNEQDHFGYTALIWAIVNENTPMVRLLTRQAGIDYSIRDNNGMPALCHATAGRNKDIMGTLLSKSRLDVNIRNSDGLTPLMLAVKHRRYTMSRMLIADGRVDYDVPDNNGLTVVDYANRAPSWKDFAILIRAGQRGRRLPQRSSRSSRS